MASPEKSTNGRTSVPAPVRTVLPALAAVAPGLAARAGARLFMSPPRAPAPERERVELAGWERTTLRTRHGRLAAWRRGAGPTVLLLHGWGGRGGQMAAIGAALVEAGCTAVIFDGPAHGASPGRRASVVHLANAAEDVARATGARAAIGHSVGGAALAFALARGLPLSAAVTIGAPRNPSAFFRAFGAALGLGAPMLARIRARIEAWVGVDMDDLDVSRGAPGPDAGAPPLLVVHDRDDAEVATGDADAYVSAWPDARLLSTEGLGHRRVLRDAAVVDDVVAFVTAHLPRCACGRLAVEGRRGGELRCAGCALAEELWSRERRRQG